MPGNWKSKSTKIDLKSCFSLQIGRGTNCNRLQTMSQSIGILAFARGHSSRHQIWFHSSFFWRPGMSLMVFLNWNSLLISCFECPRWNCLILDSAHKFRRICPNANPWLEPLIGWVQKWFRGCLTDPKLMFGRSVISTSFSFWTGCGTHISNALL